MTTTNKTEEFFAGLWNNAADAVPIHARATRSGNRALCTVAVTEAGQLSEEAAGDEDADVTCTECLRVIREAKETR